MFRNVAKSQIVFAIVLVSCFTVVVIGVSATKVGRFTKPSGNLQPNAVHKRNVVNKTQSVQVSNVTELDDGSVEIEIVNQSNKAIYAYTIVTRREPVESSITTIATQVPVDPAQTAKERISARNLDPSGVIEFSAIYSEGGSLEGDAVESGKLSQTMLAVKDQARVALQILTAAVASPERDPGKLLQSLGSQIATTAASRHQVGAGRDYESGRNFVNGRLAREINKLQMRNAANDAELKSQVRDLIPYYERLIRKL